MKTFVRTLVGAVLAAIIVLLAACAQEVQSTPKQSETTGVPPTTSTTTTPPTSEGPPPPLTVTTPPTSHEVVEGQIHVYGVHVESSLIRFSGTAGLPDRTVLRSQLYQDSTLLLWWPTGQDIAVQNGEWTISVALEDDGRPREILVGPVYRVDVWERDNPAQHSGFSFDLVGPPPVSQ